jgi:sugar phosphate permease
MHFGLGDLKVEESSSKLDSELQSSKSKEKQLRSFAKIFKYNFNNSKVFGFNKKLFSVYYVRVGLETAIV